MMSTKAKCGWISLLIAAAVCAAAAEAVSVQRTLWCRGSSAGLWVAAVRREAVVLAFRPVGQAFGAVNSVTGQLTGLAALDDRAYLAFSDGSLWRYDTQGRNEVLAKLPQGAAVAAVAGDQDTRRVYALAESAGPPESSQAAIQPTAGEAADTQPNDASPIERAGGASETEGPLQWRVYQLTGGQWEYLTDLPDEVPLDRPPVLLARNGWLEIVWKGLLGKLYYSRFDGQWSPVQALPVQPAQAWWLCALPDQLVLVTAGSDQEGRRWRLHVNKRTESGWQETGYLHSGEEPLAVEAGRIDLTAEAEHISGVWQEGDGLLAAKWRIDGSMVGSPEDVSQALQAPQGQRRQPDLLATALLIALVVMLLFMRGGWLAAPVPLPEGFKLCDFWRRGLAFVIDLMPSMVLGTVIWRDVVLNPQRQQDLLSAMQRGQTDPQMYWFGVFVVVGYAAYCFISESLAGTTLGKWVLDLHLWDARNASSRLTLRQLLIRNGFRVLELYLFLPLVLVLFTPNRQRLGDMIAGTVVIQRIRQA